MTEVSQVTSDPRLWVRIAEDLRRKITGGDIKTNCHVSIGEVSQEWGACRSTVSKALRALESDGLVRRYPGHGWYALASRK